MNTVAFIMAIVVAALLVLFLAQDRLILFPMPEDPYRADLSGIEATPWLGGGNYSGLIFEPTTPAKGTILFFHGNAGAAQYRAPYAARLTAFGYRVVLHEYPGFGARPGAASVSSALQAVLEDAQRARKEWTGPVYLMGESFGAAMAAEAAGRHPDWFDGLVLITPWKSLSSLVNEKFGGLPLSFLLKHRLDLEWTLSAFPGKMVIVAAEEDSIIPARHARLLARQLPGAHYIELKGADHNEWFTAMSDANWKEVLAAVTQDRNP